MEDTKYIEIPPYLSDNWIENNESKFNFEDKVLIALDFSSTEWVELSALLSITILLIKRIRNIKRIDILFSADVAHQSKNKQNAFLFLIESNFFMALNKAIRHYNGLCSIWFSLNPELNDLRSIQKKLALNFSLSHLTDKEIENILPIRKSSKNDQKLLGIILHKIEHNLKIDVSSFSILGYRPEKQRDKFLIPVKLFRREELRLIIEERGLLTFIKNDLFNELDIKNIIELIKKKETFNDIQSVYLVELISNAVEHSEDNADILISLRLGNWEHREGKRINNIDYWSECYNYKGYFFEANRTRIGEKFIDIHVIDTGQGFKTLEPYYNVHKEKENAPLISLHRFALFPHTSSKSRKLSTEDNIEALRITGLGVIAENIILHDGIISIKDKSILTYFDSNSLKFISNSGKYESFAISDMEHTNVSILIPISDETWLKDNHVNKIVTTKTTEKNLVLFKASKIRPLEFNEFELFETVIKKHSHKQFNDIYKIDLGTYCIIDVSNIAKVFDKNMSIRLRDFILMIKKLGFVVTIFGGTISVMKILQATIDSHKKLTDLNIQNLFSDSTILCPIITADFRIFFCGLLDNDGREELYNYFNFNKVISAPTFQLIDDWSNGANIIPVGSIERCINQIRGAQFKNDIEKTHYYTGIIQDIHGDYLDSFYEVKSYFSHSENRLKWKDDFIRYISKFEPEVIIVDCPELRLLLSEIESDLDLDISIGRINNKTIEFSKLKLKSETNVLIILSCAYNGSVIDSIPEYKKKYKLNNVATLTILDLTGKKKIQIEKIISGEYDRFSIGKLPLKLDKNGQTPNYFATSRARIVPINTMRRDFDDAFRSYIPQHSQFAALRQSSQVYYGHTIEHGHHYDTMIDVRSAILYNDRLSQHFRNLLHTRINLGRNIIVYPEDSELDPILNSVKYAPGNKEIVTVPIRRVDEDTFVWTNISHKSLIKNNGIIFLDEGIYSCTSFIGIIKLILKENPKLIDVIVLEKRLTLEMSSINFMKAFLPDIGKCRIEFYCILEILAPAFNQNNCPYCKIEVSETLENPYKIADNLLIGNEIVTYDYEHSLWLLSNIYYSREQAYSCINQLYELFRKNIDSYFFILNLLIVHNEIIQRWNLLNDFLTAIKLMFNQLNPLPIVDVLRNAKKANSSFRIKFVEFLIQKIIYKIDNKYIYYELSDIMLKTHELIPLMNNKIKVLVLPDNIQNLWNSIQEQNSNERIYRAVNFLFMVSKVNKSQPHTTFSQDLKLHGLNYPENKVKIQIIKDTIGLLEPVPPIIMKLKQIINDRIEELSALFENETFRRHLSEQYSVPAEKLIREINSIVSSSEPIFDFSTLTRTKANNIVETPLLCLQKEQYALLKMHYRDNKEYGECITSVQKGNDEIQIICTSIGNQINENSELELDTQSKRNINNILLPYGGNLQYTIFENRFRSILKLKIVDYGKNETINLR